MHASYSIAQLTALNFSPPEMIDLAARTGYDQAGVRLLPVVPGAVAYSLMDDKPMLRETLARMNDTGVKVFDLEILRLDVQFDVQRYLPFSRSVRSSGPRPYWWPATIRNKAD